MASGRLPGQLQGLKGIPFMGKAPEADPPSQPSSWDGGGPPPLLILRLWRPEFLSVLQAAFLHILGALDRQN